MKNFTTNHTNQSEQKDIFYKEECFKINNCIYEVNRKLGVGFLEAVYQEALEIELRRKNIPFVSQEEGREEANLENARKMKTMGFLPEQIQAVTGLSLETITQL